MIRLTSSLSRISSGVLLTALVSVAADARKAPAAPADTTVPPPIKRLAETSSTTPHLSTFIQAVQTAGMIGQLSEPGPFTLFAPSNSAFARLPVGTVDALLAPAGHAVLAHILAYHIVPGRLTLDDLRARVAAGGGKAVIRTLAGEPLVVSFVDQTISLTDSNGNKSYIEDADLRQANGMMHVVNGVLLPRLD